jgi:hypothetical protein
MATDECRACDGTGVDRFAGSAGEPCDQCNGAGRTRDIEDGDACAPCSGSGYVTYATTATWRGGIGGARPTRAVCNHCWGSGSRSQRWPSWRTTEAAMRLIGLLDAACDGHDLDGVPVPIWQLIDALRALAPERASEARE